jgi:hypothetical protein
VKLFQCISGAAVVACLGVGSASAAVVVDNISGSAGSAGAFTGQITLDVVGGQAVSGGGVINGLGYSNVPLALITPLTPGNETAGGPGAPVGFRANDGTDLYAFDTAYPIDANGLVFDVDTSTAQWGQYTLFGIWANGDGTYSSVFDGKVNGTEYYVQIGSATLSAVPEPAAWVLMIAGFGLCGLGLRRARAARSSQATA